MGQAQSLHLADHWLKNVVAVALPARLTPARIITRDSSEQSYECSYGTYSQASFPLEC
jgi:hypothetical protein